MNLFIKFILTTDYRAFHEAKYSFLRARLELKFEYRLSNFSRVRLELELKSSLEFSILIELEPILFLNEPNSSLGAFGSIEFVCSPTCIPFHFLHSILHLILIVSGNYISAFEVAHVDLVNFLSVVCLFLYFVSYHTKTRFKLGATKIKRIYWLV